VARPAAVALAAATLAAGIAQTADAGWGRPVRLSAPQSLDVVPAQIAFSPAGEAAIAFDVQDADDPSVSKAFVTVRSPSGVASGPRRISGALETLGIAFAGPTLELLTGSSPRGRPCCAVVRVVPSPSGQVRFGRATTIVRGLTGITDGSLETLTNGQLLAAIATQRGVWVAQSTGRGRFAAAQRLNFAGAAADLAAAPLNDGGGVVAWTVATGGEVTTPNEILVATGSSKGLPSAPRVAVKVPAGHSIDELQLAPGEKSPTLAWVESWYDARGGLHSAVEVRDLDRAGVTRTISPRFEYGSDVTLAGNGAGDQVLAFDGCSSTGACVARAAVRRAGSGFSGAQRLGLIDSSQAVTAAISASGDALVGWVSGGHVLAAERRPHARSFGRARVVSQTNYASDLTLAFGPGRNALAAWTQGTLAPSLVGATFRAQ
jgi:hypothetical protein